MEQDLITDGSGLDRGGADAVQPELFPKNSSARRHNQGMGAVGSKL